MDTPLPTDTIDLLNRASVLLSARRVEESLELFDRALALGADPLDVGGQRWIAAMLLGRFEIAWEVSDLVLRRTDPADLNRTDRPFHQRAVWNGAPLDGCHVLIRCYHGLGDILQFARYLPLVARRARSLAVQAPPSLHTLLAELPGVDTLFPLGDGVALPPYEVQAELMELPFVFRTTLATLPAKVPYLSVDGERVTAQATRLERHGRLAVGLAWAAGAWDGGHRSLPLELVERLTAMPDIDWVCLQRGEPLADADRFPFRDQGERSNDPLDTAVMIGALDLVISVDTMVAHLAGALGAPVWTLLRHEADWRWMVERDDSPWYPTMRLFRQPEPGAWEPVIERVQQALRSHPPI